MEQQEQQMLERALQGDKEALGQLFREYIQPRLYPRITTWLNGDTQEAEDILQDTFEKLLAHYEDIEARTVSRFESFVCTIARSQCINLIREQQKHTWYMITDKTLEDLTRAHLPEAVMECLESLKNKKITGYRKFLRLLNITLGKEQAAKYKNLIVEHTSRHYAEVHRDIDECSTHTMQADDMLRQNELQEFFYTTLRDILSDEEWNLLYARGIDQLTFREIQEKFGAGLATHHARYTRIVAKIVKNPKLLALWHDIKPL